jgi:hypothetical protein
MTSERIVDNRLLTDDEVRSEAYGLHYIAAALAGGTAWLYELASGEAASSDGAATPPNPQGQTGWDLSGPPWGPAIRHPIAWLGGLKPNAATGYGSTAVVGFSSDQPGLVGPWWIWNRPHDELPSDDGQTFIAAPYSRRKSRG